MALMWAQIRNADCIVLECNSVCVPTALDILSTFGFTLLLSIQVISSLTMSACSQTMTWDEWTGYLQSHSAAISELGCLQL